MTELGATYFLDLSDRVSRQRIEAAKPNTPIRVLVKLAENTDAEPIDAIGALTPDKADFLVTVTTSSGTVTHSRGWSELKEDLASHEKYD